MRNLNLMRFRFEFSSHVMSCHVMSSCVSCNTHSKSSEEHKKCSYYYLFIYFLSCCKCTTSACVRVAWVCQFLFFLPNTPHFPLSPTASGLLCCSSYSLRLRDLCPLDNCKYSTDLGSTDFLELSVH